MTHLNGPSTLNSPTIKLAVRHMQGETLITPQSFEKTVLFNDISTFRLCNEGIGNNVP